MVAVAVEGELDVDHEGSNERHVAKVSAAEEIAAWIEHGSIGGVIYRGCADLIAAAIRRGEWRP